MWAVDGSAGGKDDCLGSAQVSLADFNCTSVSVRWYNVLSFHFMQPEVMRRTTPTPTFRTSIHAKQVKIRFQDGLISQCFVACRFRM